MNEVPVSVALDPSDSVNKAVTCNDGPSSTDPDFWNRQLEELRTKAPAYFHDRLELPGAAADLVREIHAIVRRSASGS